MINKQFTSEVTKAPDKGRGINFTLSTKGKDRSGDVINGPWDLASYRKNPVVLWAHDYKSLPVGRCTSIAVVNGSLVATAQFADASLAPVADQIYQMLCAGFLKAASVGFRPLDQPTLSADGKGLVYGACELLEFSIVPVPSNPEALMRAAKSAGARAGHLTDEQVIRAIVEAVVRAQDAAEAQATNREETEIAAFVRSLDQLTTDELKALAVSL